MSFYDVKRNRLLISRDKQPFTSPRDKPFNDVSELSQISIGRTIYRVLMKRGHEIFFMNEKAKVILVWRYKELTDELWVTTVKKCEKEEFYRTNGSYPRENAIDIGIHLMTTYTGDLDMKNVDMDYVQSHLDFGHEDYVFAILDLLETKVATSVNKQLNSF